MSDLKKLIAQNLVELRKSRKYTQQDIANMVQYSDKAVSKWEKGE
jgi:transcriptional regulator with XRE-family HTH domain